MEDVTNKRALNFSDAEKLALSTAVRDRATIICSKDEDSKAMKDKAWKEITAAVNAVSNKPRKLAQIKKKYQSLKSHVKVTEAHNRKEIQKTGGGPANIIEQNEVGQIILETIPDAAIEGITGGYDMHDIPLFSASQHENLAPNQIAEFQISPPSNNLTESVVPVVENQFVTSNSVFRV